MVGSRKTSWAADAQPIKPQGYEHKYNAEAVNKGINAAYRGQKPPSLKQRSVTHALLRGRE